MDQPAELAEPRTRAPRTNLFIAATVDVRGRSMPVRVRNMSQTGALIETSSGLAPGTPLTLRRGDHVASGWIVWCDGQKCGISFAEAVSVSEWMGRPLRRDPEGQRQVDAIQAQIRSGAAPQAGPEPAKTILLPHELQQRLSEELAGIKQVIDEIGDRLSSEPLLMDRHAESMQQFDIVGQTLGHLAKLLVSSDPARAVDEIGMESLRKRLMREREGARADPSLLQAWTIDPEG
ncbi:MAG: PilZ protein [Alphaproteobacteria bacterium]|nr:PilZ protein [Alphaproteobacteria bacterium]MDB5721368.1 PilZ protein [Alphaproteobacteria bacterium]